MSRLRACTPHPVLSLASNGPCSLYQCPVGTADTDRSPSSKCVACDGKSGFADATGLTVCKRVTLCGAGEFQASGATPKSDAVCLKCPEGFYNAQISGTCIKATDCSFGAFQASAPTATSNRVCKDCEAGKYKDVRGNEGECQSVTASCPAGFEVTRQPSLTNDRKWANKL